MRIEIFQDRAGEWRWRLRAPNGRILADGSEGYSSKPGVRRSVANFVKYLREEPPVEEVRVREDVVDAAVKVRVSRPRAASRKAA